MLPRDGQLLRIFISETDKYEGKPLFEWIIQQAKDFGLAGATVLRGLEGYGARSRIHSAKILRLADELPIVIEIVDVPDKIDAFWPVIDEAVKEGLATVEKVQIKLYRGGKK